MCSKFYQQFLRWNGSESSLAKCFRATACMQIVSGLALMIFGIADAAVQPEENHIERIVATSVFSVLTSTGAGCGLVSLCIAQVSSYRLLQLFHLSLNLLLLPGCGFYMLLLRRIIEDTNAKLLQPSWTYEEKQEEIGVQRIRYVLLALHGLIISLQMAAGFLNCIILWRFPESMRHVRLSKITGKGSMEAEIDPDIKQLYATI
ncbi:uncharacterized protein LOC129589018 [Paramacrobiotus metropolitanus]|uniref:uncharacterized protein LOC129589018 n=1 Tax=Paramacrobiotus metropolitanus TaxID=2943436 RepID=UPI0024464BC4|nr:uncharacterized protein LOC129589018 [Paramacrobiotus metropolitanus]